MSSGNKAVQSMKGGSVKMKSKSLERKTLNNPNIRGTQSEQRPWQWERKERKGKTNPRKLLLKNCKYSIIEKNGVKDVSEVAGNQCASL